MADNPLAVGWDLDSTLASTMHRRYLVPEIKAGRATWDDYSDLSSDDAPVAGAVALARLLCAAGHPQYAISGRSGSARDRTLSWFRLHDVPMDRLILRPAGDRTDNKLFKVRQIHQLQDQGVKFCLFVEDWQPVAEYITEQTGIPVLGVNPFDPETALVSRAQLAVVVDELNSFGFQPGDGPEVADAIFPLLGGAF
jgi:hypothetical protein